MGIDDLSRKFDPSQPVPNMFVGQLIRSERNTCVAQKRFYDNAVIRPLTSVVL